MLIGELHNSKSKTEFKDFFSNLSLQALPSEIEDWPARIALKKKIDGLIESCPLVELLSSSHLKEHHWTQLEDAMEQNFDSQSPNLTFGVVLQAPVVDFKEDVVKICDEAKEEFELEKAKEN